jgi:predicted ribosomally synthesized peptide with nif11-like leader
MSAKSVKAFFQEVEGNRALHAKLTSVHKKTTKESQAKAAAEVVRIAATAGFKFTTKELAAACGKKPGKASKKQLGDVTGQFMNCSGGTYNYCTAANWQCIGYSWY